MKDKLKAHWPGLIVLIIGLGGLVAYCIRLSNPGSGARDAMTDLGFGVLAFLGIVLILLGVGMLLDDEDEEGNSNKDVIDLRGY